MGQINELTPIPLGQSSYQCLSSNITSGSVSNAIYRGANIYFTDTQTWYRVRDDLTIVPLVHNVSISGSGFTISGSLTTGSLVQVTNFPTNYLISGSVIIASGSIAISNLPTSYLVSGSVTITGSVITGSNVSVSNFPAIQITSGCITNLADLVINVSASSITLKEISGSVNVLNFPAKQIVSGSITNFPTTQIISGCITNFPSTQIISGCITNFPTTQIISGCVTNLPIAYSGSITNLPPSYSGSITNFAPNFASGSISITQNVIADSGNSFSGSLAVGGSFVGTGVSTLGVGGIQISLFTNQNATVIVEQSPDNTNWDIDDIFNYYTSKNNFGITVQAISSYFRVSIINTGLSIASTVRLQSALCPVVEALPRALTNRGNLQVSIEEFTDPYGFNAENTPNGETRSIVPYRLVGSTFSGSVLDTNYWTSGSGSGSIVLIGSQAIITTGSVSNGNQTMQSFRSARYVGGASNRSRIVMRLPDGGSGTVNNTRRWGAFTVTDGAFFQLSGSTLGIITRKTGADSPISSGAFNGTLGTEYRLPLVVRTYEIYWNNSKVYFTINGEILHTVSADSATWTDTLSLPIRFENFNSGSSTTNVAMNIRAATIYRLGAEQTQPTSFYFSGQAASGSQLKIGNGNLQAVIFSNILNNAVFTLSDSTTGTTPSIFSYTAGANSTLIQTIDFKGLPFFNGLRATCTTANVTCTIIYE